jgi:N6-L-threonylcarbamoyladenine synthase
MARVERALDAEPEPRLAIGGGVAANRLLRERATALGVPVHVPPPALCTDNAAMIGSAARWVAPRAFPDYLELDAYPARQSDPIGST